MKYAENNRISHRQLYRQMILALMSPLLLTLTGRISGRNGVLAAGIAAGLADEAREGDAAPKAGITHKDVPPKKMSRDPDPMTSYEAKRAFVRDSVARCIPGGKT